MATPPPAKPVRTELQYMLSFKKIEFRRTDSVPIYCQKHNFREVVPARLPQIEANIFRAICRRKLSPETFVTHRYQSHESRNEFRITIEEFIRLYSFAKFKHRDRPSLVLFGSFFDPRLRSFSDRGQNLYSASRAN
jgi:hypothetical protein